MRRDPSVQHEHIYSAEVKDRLVNEVPTHSIIDWKGILALCLDCDISLHRYHFTVLILVHAVLSYLHAISLIHDVWYFISRIRDRRHTSASFSYLLEVIHLAGTDDYLASALSISESDLFAHPRRSSGYHNHRVGYHLSLTPCMTGGRGTYAWTCWYERTWYKGGFPFESVRVKSSMFLFSLMAYYK